MSIKIVQPEIERFLSDKEPGVLVIAGKWGVGKTFAWNRFLKEAKEAGKVAASYYAYVSLFGLGNLEELKAAIFQNTVKRSDIGKTADLETLEGVVRSAPSLWRKGGTLARLIPGADRYLSTFERVGFFWLRDQVICIDDLERKSRSLDIRDVLGLISHLKEQRRCKVVLLLNDEKFGDEDSAEFRGQLEKVADIMLRFDPTPAEAAGIGVDRNKSFHDELRRHCESLGIVNIRTIKRLERVATRLAEDLREFDSRVLTQAIHSLMLFGFAKFQPGDAPSLEFIRGLNTYEALVAEEEGHQPRRPEWKALLTEYGFGQVDEFDAVILSAVQEGHIDPDALHEEARKLERRLQASDGDHSFSQAWEVYHQSFDNNGDVVAEGLAEAVRRTPKAISPMNLSSTIALLKELGWAGDVGELLAAYTAGREDEGKDFWDLAENTFGGEVRDRDVRDAFAAKLAAFEEDKDPANLLMEIGRAKGWNPADVDFLAGRTADELYDIFKALRGVELKRAVAGALMFKGTVNPSDSMRQVTDNAVAALTRIAAESPVNRRRVLQRGVELPPAEENPPPT